MTTQENTTKGQIPSSPWASDATQTSSVAQAEQLAQKTDKEIILDDLKQTMRDLGRIPRMIMAPVITYIASKREHIPEERRNHLQKIVRDIKWSGSDGIQKLKEWFGSKHEDTPAGTPATPDTTTPAAVSSTPTSSDTKSSATEPKAPAPAAKPKSTTARTTTTSSKWFKKTSTKPTKSPTKKSKDTA